MNVRPAEARDAAAIAAIYNDGIASRSATFETEPRTATDVAGWLDRVHPVVVADDEGTIAGFAASQPYASRPCYAGISEFSVYVAESARRRGVGRQLMDALACACAEAGFWKLTSRVFPENAASRALLRDCGFREVGVYERHGKLEGEWRDCVIVEKLIGEGASTIGK
jgi:L-amino acid N-acyltransferase YncA